MANILIVDRDSGAHDLLAPALACGGWRVESSYDPELALQRLQAESFDVVLADPDGFLGGACEWLRRARMLRPEARVLVMAAEAAPANVLCALREQAFGYFTKPFAPRAVADMVAQAADTPAWQDDVQVVSARPEWISLRVRSKLEAVERVVLFLRELKVDLPAAQRENIIAVVRELLLNAIEHGAGSDPRKRVGLSCVRTRRAIIYHIEDPGPGFSMDHIGPTALTNPAGNPARHLELREEMGMRPGGFGILLARNLADELVYSEKGNEVLFIKYLKEE